MAKCEHFEEFDVNKINHNLVIRECCTLCFESQDSPLGLDICLTCFNSGCKGDLSHSDLHVSKTSHFQMMNVKRKAIVESEVDRAKKVEEKIKKMIVEQRLVVDDREEVVKYEYEINPICLLCKDTTIDRNNEKIQYIISLITESQSGRPLYNRQPWETQTTECEHTISMVVEPNTSISPVNLDDPVCSECDIKDNLWLCLSCAAIGCGRMQYGGTKGNSHALLHSNKFDHPLGVRIGTITPISADVFCYKCDEERDFRRINQKLKSLNIDPAHCSKTAKTTAELNIEANMKFGLGLLDEDLESRRIEPRKFLVGIKNLGNTCYFSSVFQVLASTKEFREDYFLKGKDRLLKCHKLPFECFNCQIVKLLYGIGMKQMEQLPKGGSDKDAGLPPHDLVCLFGSNNRGFATSYQQDALEFYELFINNIENFRDYSESNFAKRVKFKFQYRRKCLSCKSATLNIQDSYFLMLRIPDKNIESENKGEVQNGLRESCTLNECLDFSILPIQKSESFCNKENSKTPTECFSGRFATFPEILVIGMCRFYADDTNALHKLNTKIKAPTTIDMSPYKAISEDDDEVVSDFEPDYPQSVVDEFVSMGFDKEKCINACVKLKTSNKEAIMNYLLDESNDLSDNNSSRNQNSKYERKTKKFKPSEEDILSLVEMGFPRSSAERALVHTNGDRASAVSYITDEDINALETRSSSSFSEGLQEEAKPQMYKLKGVVVHRGSNINCGHYISYFYSEEINSWVLANDSRLSRIDNIDEATENGYLYFYTRCD